VQQLPGGNLYPINLFFLGAVNLNVYHLLSRQFFENKYNIGFFWWELDRFPPAWLDHFKIYHELWAGSHFVRQILAQNSPVPVRQMNIPIPPPEASSGSRASLDLPADKHIFLFVFDPFSNIERKNPLAVVEAYRQAFGPDFNQTLLVLKTKDLDQYPQTARCLREEMMRVSGRLINRSVSRAEVNALFHACDTYVSLHRSEGFGATLAEAMLLSKPVIATAYSGNMDFMTPANSYPVAYKLVEIKEDAGPYQKGNRWAEPDLAEAAALMQRVVAQPEEAARKGQLAKQDIERCYNVEAVAQALVKRLEAIYAHIR
jgi:glycosyltransferase involved in cell wall biosynthesis